MEKKEVVAMLLKNGGKLVKDLTLKNVTVTVMENYVRIALTVDKELDGMIAQEDGTYKEGKTKVIFVSLYSITAQLKDNENAAFAVNDLLRNPNGAEVILSRAKINVIQEAVKAGMDYKNPWSEKEDASITHFDHNTIINHVIDIELSDRANALLDRLALNKLGM